MGEVGARGGGELAKVNRSLEMRFRLISCDGMLVLMVEFDDVSWLRTNGGAMI